MREAQRWQLEMVHPGEHAVHTCLAVQEGPETKLLFKLSCGGKYVWIRRLVLISCRAAPVAA